MVIRSPFKKQDKGGSFVCTILMFSIVQCIFYYMYLKVVYIDDLTVILINKAEGRGYKMTDEDPFDSRPLLPANDRLNQKEGFFSNDKMWVMPAFVYFFTFLFLLSYFRLVCSDISSRHRMTEQEFKSLPNFETLNYCKTCSVFKERGIYHCNECNVCVDLHDHHCGMMSTCICGKNFKFFILMQVYAGCLFFSIGASIIVLQSSLTNSTLKSEMFIERFLVIAIMMILGFAMFSGAVLFLQDSPWCGSNRNHPHQEYLEMVYDFDESPASQTDDKKQVKTVEGGSNMAK
mmetsp:Transcript_33967/g.52277  ORF Transcript_33967/g.52277 Transcript_33967/m.52277 type:complete len:290 (+) Transcript_33967:324-1193(+)